MLSRKFALTLCLLTSLALIAAGCGSDDSNPTGPAGDTLNLSDDQAETFGLTALDMVNELVNIVPDFAEGDFESWNTAKSQGDSIVWDPIQQAYTFDYDGPLFEMDPPNVWTIRMSVWVQYRNAAGQPLENPIGATEMEVDYTTGMTMHMVENGNTSDMDYDMETSMVVGYLGEGQSYSILGSGATTVSMNQVSAQGSESGQFSMNWNMDLDSTPEGCPSGTASVHVQDFTMNASYDGQGNVNWTLVGDNYQASGTDYTNCSSPAK